MQGYESIYCIMMQYIGAADKLLARPGESLAVDQAIIAFK